MTSKNYSLPQLKTLLSHTYDDINSILLSPLSHNNHQYYENFTILTLRTIKYINHYLNRINFDHHIGTTIDSIIAALDQSLQEYKGRNIFTSSCIVSPFRQEQEEGEEDQIYHFMNTRNKSIPLQCLGNPELQKQRIELAEFVQSMEKKKTTFKEQKKSLELPTNTALKLKTVRKATYDPTLTPIKEEENNVHSYKRLPVTNSRPSQEQAETQTQFTNDYQKETEKDLQKEQQEQKSQILSAFVSQAQVIKVIPDKKEEISKSQKKTILDKKRGNRKLEGKGRKKKKAKIMDVGFYSNGGSRKGITFQGEQKYLSGQCSLKLMRNLSEKGNLGISSKEVQIALYNTQEVHLSLTEADPNNKQKQQQKGSQVDILAMQEGENDEKDDPTQLLQSKTTPLNMKFTQRDATRSKKISESKLMNYIKETDEQIIEQEKKENVDEVQNGEEVQDGKGLDNEEEVNEISDILGGGIYRHQSKINQEKKGKELGEIDRKNKSKFITRELEIVQQPLPISSIHYREEKASDQKQLNQSQIHKRKNPHKRSTLLLNVNLGNSIKIGGEDQPIFFRKSTIVANSQSLTNNKELSEQINILVNQGVEDSSKRDQERGTIKITSQQNAIDQRKIIENLIEEQEIVEQKENISYELLSNNKENQSFKGNQQEGNVKNNSISKGYRQNKKNSNQFYNTSDGFGKYLGSHLQDKIQGLQSRGPSMINDPMIKILPQSKFSSNNGIKDSKNQFSDEPIPFSNQRLKMQRKSNFLSLVSEQEAQKLKKMLATRSNKTSILYKKTLTKENDPIKEDFFTNAKSSKRDSSGSFPKHQYLNKRLHNSQENIIKSSTSTSQKHPFKSTIATANETLKASTSNSSKKYKRTIQSVHTSNQNEQKRQLDRLLRETKRKQILMQYLQLIEATHSKFCGPKCSHLQNIFTSIGEDGEKMDDNLIRQLLRIFKKAK